LAFLLVSQAGLAQETCLSSSSKVIELGGTGQTDFNVDAGTGIDARGVEWKGTTSFLVKLEGGPNLCWSGGRILGTWNQESTLWDTYHSTSGIDVRSGNTTIEDLWVDNYGDALRQRNPANPWTVRRSLFTDIHDDAIENEDHGNLLMEDNLLDGVFVAISTQNSDTGIDGSGNVMELRGNLMRLQEFAHSYKETKGHGGFFKNDKDGRGPDVAMHDNVLVAGPTKGMSGHSLFPYLTKVASCSNNRFIWMGTQSQLDAALAKGSGPDGLNDAQRLQELSHCIDVVVTGDSSNQALQQHWVPLVEQWKATHAAAGGDATSGPASIPDPPRAPTLLKPE